MNLLQAFQSAISGREDKAGITLVDVYLSETKNDQQHSEHQKVAEVLQVIEADLDDEERKWFLLSSVILKWNLPEDAIAETIREVIAEGEEAMSPKTRYHALRAMGYANEGLLPNDILEEHDLRNSTPKLWLELFLAAHQNGNPNAISEQIIALVKGHNPKLSWRALRSLLPEVRQAYGSVPQFRKHIVKIAMKINSIKDRQDILKSAEKRVGGGLDTLEELGKPSVRARLFDIPTTPIRNDIKFSQMLVSSSGELSREIA